MDWALSLVNITALKKSKFQHQTIVEFCEIKNLHIQIHIYIFISNLTSALPQGL